MINIAELLKDCPEGTKLYSPLFGEVKLKCANLSVAGFPIVVKAKNDDSFLFDKYGRYLSNTKFPDGECLLFPSKDYRTWQGWTPCVEPKFKVGDWIVRGEGFVYEPSLITEIRDYYICELLNGERVTYTLNDVHKNFHLWTLTDAKDGDVIAFNDSPDVNFPLRWIGIYKQPRVVSNKSYWFHCIITPDHTFRGYDSWWVSNVHPATKEQHDLLFTKMKEAGYQWDENKKELRKIKPHYDIANFKPYDKVLIRVGNKSKWTCDFFSYYHKGFHCIGCDDWSQCIPYNDDTKHLLGTTVMCDEQYINW